MAAFKRNTNAPRRLDWTRRCCDDGEPVVKAGKHGPLNCWLPTRPLGHHQCLHLTSPETSRQSRTAWGPFFERKTRKMRPQGGRLKRDCGAK